MKYKDWQAAGEASRIRRAAISRDDFPGLTAGKRCFYKIVKPLRGDPYPVYSTAPGIKVDGIRISASDCDRVKDWAPF